VLWPAKGYRAGISVFRQGKLYGRVGVCVFVEVQNRRKLAEEIETTTLKLDVLIGWLQDALKGSSAGKYWP